MYKIDGRVVQKSFSMTYTSALFIKSAVFD